MPANSWNHLLPSHVLKVHFLSLRWNTSWLLLWYWYILYIFLFSYRVEGKGAATISEVSFQSKHVPPNEAERSQRSKELREELEALELQETELLSEQAVLKKQWELLDSFANSASRTSLVRTCKLCVFAL